VCASLETSTGSILVPRLAHMHKARASVCFTKSRIELCSIHETQVEDLPPLASVNLFSTRLEEKSRFFVRRV